MCVLGWTWSVFGNSLHRHMACPVVHADSNPSHIVSYGDSPKYLEYYIK